MKKFLKVFIVALLGIFFLKIGNLNVYAEVNKQYADITASPNGALNDNIEEDNSKVTAGDVIMKYIGQFIFSIAQLLESAITTFSSWAFGVDVFPWEDYIVFNTLPYLDINFFSPAAGSIFKLADGSVTNGIGNIIRSVYFSLLTVSLSILGIGVAITAIRLAISTIAAEKAKYKEAITKCLYTVVMLFSVHILISFIFYLNETIVTGAGNMLSSVLNDQELIKQNINDYASSSEKQKLNAWMARNINFDKSTDANFWDVAVDTVQDFASDVKKYLLGGLNKKQKEKAERLANKAEELLTSDKAYAIARYITKQKEFTDSLDYYISDNGLGTDNKSWSNNIDDAQSSVQSLLNRTEAVLNAKSSEELKKDYQKEAYDMFMDNKKINLISSLATYFKGQVQDVVESDDINYVPLLLYCIILIQSVMLLLNYIKRIFYVTLLAVLAPVVVIYDFFMTAI